MSIKRKRQERHLQEKVLLHIRRDVVGVEILGLNHLTLEKIGASSARKVFHKRIVTLDNVSSNSLSRRQYA